MPNLIKLTNYPYQEYQVGEICDFGEDKNKSLVAFGRAVWYEDSLPVIKASVKEVELEESPVENPKAEEALDETPQEVTENAEILAPVEQATTVAATPKKKLLQNKLRDKVQQKTQSDSKSFWDRLR